MEINWNLKLELESEIISLTGYQFSPRFSYVLAETILYKKYDILFFILMASS